MAARSARPGLRSFGDWLGYAERRFRRARLAFGHGTQNAFDEAAWLLLNVIGHPYGDIQGALAVILDAAQRRSAARLIEARVSTRVPLAYLLREAWLGEHRFYVDPRVIVPRSHIAGIIAARCSPWVKQPRRVRRALDMCTGSGCLAILLALAFPQAQVDAADISPQALSVARRNVRDYRLCKRVHPICSDLYEQLDSRRYDLIVANPPYVSTRKMAALPREYSNEPPMALAGGKDGLQFVRRLLEGARNRLTQGGILVVETGGGQRALERSFPKTPFTWIETGTRGGGLFVLAHDQLPDPA